MPDTTSDTGASFTDDPNGSKAVDHQQLPPGGSHDPNPDIADEMEDTLPRRAITAAQIAAFRAARESSVSRVEAPPDSAEPAPDAAIDEAEEHVGAADTVAESVASTAPDAREQLYVPADASAEAPPTTSEPAQSTPDPARTQPVEETELPHPAPPAAVTSAENALHAAASDVQLSASVPAAATVPVLTPPPRRPAQPPQPVIEDSPARQPEPTTSEYAATARPAEMLPKAASVAVPTQILFPPQLPPPPHEHQRVVDVSGIHSRVPPDYWLEEDPLEEARIELGLTGSRPIVREAGRPLPKPQRFRGLPRWASVLALVVVTAFIGVACAILFAIASQALLHPATPPAPPPTHTAAPTGTARQ